MGKVVYKKGYTLEVDSWENDGDFNRTKTVTVEDLEQAKAWKRMCDTLFQSDHGRGIGISNEYDELLEYFEDNINEFFDNDPYLKNIPVDERLVYVENCIDKLLGGSEEGYSARVSERCTIFHVKEDVILEIVE